MIKKASTLVLVLGLALALGHSSDAFARAPQPVPGRVVVTFKQGVTPAVNKAAGIPQTGIAQVDGVLARHGATEFRPLFAEFLDSFPDPATRSDLARFYVMEHADKAGNDAVNAELKALPMVETAESDLLLEADGTAYLPNDVTQWHLRNLSLGGSDIRAVGGWSESLGDSNVVVAVLDTGVDWHHPDLGGPHPDKVNGAIWTNWAEYYGIPNADDDGNGFVDDVRGWDFVNVASSLVYPGEDYGPADKDPMDFNGHGTLVSGCIAPITNNGIGVAAAAPGCKIMPVRIGFQQTDGTGVSYASLMASGFLYAAANGADIINLSYGTGFTTAFASAINTALNAGLVICVSAGNDNDSAAGYLQGLSDDRILTVAATGSGDTKTSFSSYGTWVDISAPGEGISTTAYHWSSGLSTYESTQGTSFSSPIAAGACALIWSAHPEYDSAQVAALIQSSADNIDGLNPGYAGLLGAGRVNLQRALGDNVHKFPQEFPTLFDAMNCSSFGDTIKVRSTTTLTGPVNVLGRGLKIFGAYDATYDTRDLVSGRTPIGGDSGVLLTFNGVVSAATEIDGFDIAGGTGQNMSILAPNTRAAGGVLVNQVSPTLRNLKVHGNTVGNGAQLGCGGGILLSNSSSLVENCEITGNTGVYGAGVFVIGGAPTLRDCSITDNTLLTTNLTYTSRGGGVYASDAHLTIENCTISGHLGAELGGGVYAGGQSGMSTLQITDGSIAGNTAKGAGGGLYQTGGTLSMNGTILENNGKTPASTFMYGGGAQITGGAVATVTGVTCRGNQAQIGGGLALTACGNGSAVTGSVLSGNVTQFWGGGLSVETCPGSSIAGNTVYGNTGGAGGGGIYVSNCSPVISNNISAGNLGGASFGNGIALSGATVSPTCNDVFGNQGSAWTGITDPTGTAGNVAVDPLFCDAPAGNFQLQALSPCRAENNGGCGQIGALLGSCGLSPVPGSDGVLPAAFRVEQNFPNPFNPKTTIRFALPTAARTTVDIYDVAGHHVKSLLDADLPAQTHDVVWTGDDAQGRPVAAGVYFYEVNGGGHRAVGRMALVK